jgi:hypothetical protein
MKIEKFTRQLPILILFLLYLIHGYYILTHLVNIPYWDEWEFFGSDGFKGTLSLHWIFGFHNEHRIVFTQLLNYILFLLTDLNIKTLSIVNYLIFGIILILTKKVLQRSAPQYDLTFSQYSLLFLLSPLLAENHIWGFQSQFHFVLLFLFSGQLLLFSNKAFSVSRLIFVTLTLIFAAYSFSAGMLGTLSTVTLYLVLQLILFFKHQITSKQIILTIFASIIAYIASALYLVDYHPHPGHPTPLLPWNDRFNDFFNFFKNLISFGFGFSTTSIEIANWSALIVILPFIALGVINLIKLFRSGERLQSTWLLLAAELSIFGALILITYGRGDLGAKASKAQRYSEFAVVLIPFSICCWEILLQKFKPLKNLICIGIILFALNGHFEYILNPRLTYKNHIERRLEGQKCVRDYLHQKSDGGCPTLYPVNISEKLEYAKKLNISFIQELSAN